MNPPRASSAIVLEMRSNRMERDAIETEAAATTDIEIKTRLLAQIVRLDKRWSQLLRQYSLRPL